jgi:hypothetical protein
MVMFRFMTAPVYGLISAAAWQVITPKRCNQAKKLDS